MTGSPSGYRHATSKRRTALAGMAALVGTPMLGGAGSRSSTLTSGHGSQGLRELLGDGAISVIACGAIGDGIHDDTDAFLKACAETPVNGVVLVPRSRAAYKLRRTIPLASRSLIGSGWPILAVSTTDPEMDLVRVDTQGGSYDDWHQSSVLCGLILSASSQGRDLVCIAGANAPQLRDLRLIGAGRDGLHVEGTTTGSWTESLCAINIFGSGSRRDNFHLAIHEEADESFINQTTFLNCKSRGPGRYALACINRSRHGSDNAKISELSWINGELDGSGAAADDIVMLETQGPGIIEYVSFYDVAIEDVNARHPGYAVKLDPTNGGRIQNVHMRGCIPYGVGSGASNSDDVSEATSSKVPAGRAADEYGQTRLLQTNEAMAIGKAPDAGLLKVFAMGSTGSAHPVLCEWTVFGDAIAVLSAVGCELSIAQHTLVITNTFADPVTFKWRVHGMG
jgi:hypothetical protein